MLLNAKLSAIEQERGQLFDTIFHLRKNTLLHDYATPSIQFHNLKCMYIPSMLTRKPYVEMILHIRLRSNSDMYEKLAMLVATNHLNIDMLFITFLIHMM